jgi:hypothetical protein
VIRRDRGHSWISVRKMAPASNWLTPRRIRAHAIILAVCLWGVCAVDYSRLGLFDRAGNIKFQDFLQFPISAHLIAQGRAAELYVDQVLAEGIREIAGNTRVELKYFYGPQVAWPFIPLGRFSFLTQAEIWAALSLFIYFGCIRLIWKSCGTLNSNWKIVALCALAYPPLFHFFVRGQLSAAILLFVTAAYVAFRAQHEWLAGMALGFLVLKPQFLVAIPFVLLAARAWKPFVGLVIGAGAQLALTFFYFGRAVMRAYFTMLLHSASQPGSTELRLSPIQMHSLHTFWELLVPWPHGVWIFDLLTSIIVFAIAAAIWRSSNSLALRFSALIIAAVLVNPHIYIYDLLALAPALLLLADWSIKNPQHPSTPALRALLYLAFVLPLLGPLARWTHVQLSVVVFVALLWILHRIATSDQKLAFPESAVV